MGLAVVNTFWTGPRLGPIHAACLQSFLTHGHVVRLFAYDAPGDVPAGIEILPASEILPFASVRAYAEARHFELVSDLFRYRLLAAAAGLWVDADCLCVRAIEDDDYIFGRETSLGLNTAVLKLPATSPVLSALCSIAPGFIPPWETRRRRSILRLRRMIGRPQGLELMTWGTAGPAAFSYYARRHGIDQLAAPSDVFYPIHWDHAERLCRADLTLADLITPRTKVVHLYTSVLKDRTFRHQQPEPGSPIALLSTPPVVARAG